MSDITEEQLKEIIEAIIEAKKAVGERVTTVSQYGGDAGEEGKLLYDDRDEEEIN